MTPRSEMVRYYPTVISSAKRRFDEPTILFRADPNTEDELEVAQRYFPVERQRAQCYDSLVIGRYSMLPFYREVCNDLKVNSCAPVNSYKQHKWISSFDYYVDLVDFTPTTWDDYTLNTAEWDGPFVVKGETTSKKFEWNTLMFAEDKTHALEIASKLLRDGELRGQKLIYRKYVKLKTFEIGLNGLPFTNEWRFFFYKDQQLALGYYWSCANDLTKPYMTIKGTKFANEVAKVVSMHVPFFCLDIAETEEGEWILIEVNDAQQSGLQEVDPDVLYQSLQKALTNERKQSKRM